ncbi:hypothetical protein MY1884_003141 [Beauveria asiatica]
MAGSVATSITDAHISYLRQVHTHHEGRRDEMRARLGDAAHEWEATHHQLTAVSMGGRKGKGRDERNDDAWPCRGGWQETRTRERGYDKVVQDASVGIIHSNGEHMAEEPTGHELLRFAITFIMSWKIWTKVTFTLSWFESDDVLTKLKVLFNLACLLGFTTNMISSFNQDAAHNTYVQLVAFYLATRYATASNGGYNLNAFLGKAILGLLQAFFFNCIYFDIDANGIGLHAIRRSAVVMGVWTNAHLPFIMGYIIATSALSRLVLSSDMSSTHPEQLTENYRALAEQGFSTGVRYFDCHGLALALLSMTAIAVSHRHHSVGAPRLAKRYRLANRVAVAVVIFFLPLAPGLKSLYLVSITLGLISWVLILELWGVSLKGHSFVGETHHVRKELGAKKEEDNANMPCD